ncbi:MAG TPA: efflux RND transporter periplasmic adaptor subunit [Gemmatimonadaceae bacterium]|nr:efflux RND transporter periplasmic adaptor subunit [Gemmatimonadaceae bacterium]
MKRVLLLSCALPFLAVLACNKTDEASAAPKESTVVNIGPENITLVENTELASGPRLSGQLTAERSASIRSEVSASVLSVLHEQGDRVEAGAQLVKLDDTAIRDMWLSARSGVTAAKTLSDQAQREVQRAERLHGVGAISDRDLESARNAAVTTQAQLADAQARLAGAQKQLDATSVKAPFAGIVAERQASAGDVVSPGAPLLTLIDPASLRLEAAVPAANLSEVRTGMRARFTVTGYGDRTFDGKITNVNPSADPSTGQVRIYASIPNSSGQLVAGLFAEGRVTTETRKGLSAPVAAVDQRALRPTVVRLRGGKIERIEVTLGVRDEERERFEISGGGIAAGDTLLLGAAQGITPGSVVKVSAPEVNKK